jgi:nucleoside-diphosphate-sugar epimerase
MKSNILCSGAEGFIGTEVMNLNPFFEATDVKTGSDIKYIDISKYGFLVLLAADLGHDQAAFDHNLEIYRHLMKFPGAKPHVIYTSSAAVYGEGFSPHRETEVPKPEGLYGRSKYLGELVTRMTFDDYTILRLGNVYGDGQGNGVVDIFKNGGNTIYGDGKQIRDYVHVSKVAQAITRIVAMPDEYRGKTFNISSGEGRTVKEMFAKFGTGEPEYVEPREFDVQYSVLDNSLARREKLL